MTTKPLMVLALAGLIVAAGPAAPPVITLDGLATAAKLSPATKAAIAPQVMALNAAFEKLVAYRAANPKATKAQLSEDLKDLHEELMRLHDTLMKTIDPAQHAACLQYMHEAMKAAGLEHVAGDHMKHMRDGLHKHSGGTHGGW